ncbi:MAG TPA: hypothetical protein VGK58_07660 [Lacipirellulaceae bacterium]
MASLWRTTPVLLSLAMLLMDAATSGAAISIAGNVTPDPNTTTSSRALFIGQTANGTMAVDAGSVVTSGTSYLGVVAVATGTATVTGNGSAWNSGVLVVGNEGNGHLTVTGGGLVNSSGTGYVGDELGSNGTVEVSGADSQWHVRDGIWMGLRGTGALTISDGGFVTSTSGVVGNGSEAVGHATVTGSGSRWINSSFFRLGSFGTGTMTIANGGMVFSDVGSIGSSSSGNGRLTIEGVDSKWLITNDLAVGDSGNGIIEITGGVAQVGGDTYLGRSISGAGEIRFQNGTLTTRSLLAGFSELRGIGTINTQGIVSDYDLIFDSNDRLLQQVIFASEPDQNITVNLDASPAGVMGAGFRGQGSLTVADGRAVASREGFLGYHTTARATANVNGVGSSWTLSGDLSVGYNGAGTLNVSNGGHVHVAGTTYVARFSGSAGGIRFNNGILTTQMLSASPNQLTGTGVINTHGVVGDMDLVFDQAHPPQQQLLLNDGPDQNVTVNLDIDGSAELGVGYSGEASLTIADGVTVASTFGHLGIQPGSKGTATVSGENSKWAISGNLFIGRGGVGELTLADGGALSNDAARIDNGKLVVSGSGSTWTNTGLLLVAADSNSNAELLIEDGAHVSSAMLSGLSSASRIGTGYMSTGKATVTGPGSTWIDAAYLTVGADGTGMLTISNGGRIFIAFGSVGAFGFSFGSNGSGMAVVTGAGSSWHIDERLAIGTNRPGTLTISDGGQVSSASGDIGNDSAANGTVIVTGDGSRWTITDDLYVGRSFGQGTLNIGPGGTVFVGDVISISSSSRLNLEGGTLAASSMPPNPDGRFNWTAGTLHVGRYNGNLINSAGVLAPGQSAGSTTITGNYT